MIHFIGMALAVQHIVNWNSSNHSWNQQSWRELWFLPVFLLGISEIYHLISPKYDCGQWFSICYSNCLYSFYIYLYMKCFFISKMDHWHIFFSNLIFPSIRHFFIFNTHDPPNFSGTNSKYSIGKQIKIYYITIIDWALHIFFFVTVMFQWW